MRSLAEDDVRRVADALKPDRLEKTVTPELTRGIVKWGERVLASLGSSASFDLRNPLVKDYLDAWREQRIVGITEVTRDEVTAILREVVAEGVGIGEAKARLRVFFEEQADYRAERIARTEVVSSSNAANLAAYQISGAVDLKEWLSVQDDRTRETHADLDGQRVGITDEFVSPGGSRSQGPGLFGIAEEDINCRCTLRPVIADLASPTGEARAREWRAYVDDLEPFERDVRAAAATVFGQWLGDAVAALG